MQNLTAARQELFRRSPDECFESLEALDAHCRGRKEASLDRWHPPAELATISGSGNALQFAVGAETRFGMNDSIPAASLPEGLSNRG